MTARTRAALCDYQLPSAQPPTEVLRVVGDVAVMLVGQALEDGPQKR
jgi:hypothetical protein